MIAELAEPGDLVVCLGAGSITNWAHALPDELIKLYTSRGGTAEEPRTAQ
jgi:UDP-N-acetylmuramate--alanine ligase